MVAAAMLNTLRDLKKDDVVDVVSERMVDGVYIFFSSDADAVHRWGGKKDNRNEKMGNLDGKEWLGATFTVLDIVELK